LAVDHLISLGHRAIGYLGAGNRPRSNRLRQQAYLDGLAQAAIRPKQEWIQTALAGHRYHSEDVSDGQALLSLLVEQGVTAIFCYNDMLAAGTLLACRERSIAVPESLSIVGFDDIDLARLVTPPLTTVHQPRLRLGQLAMQMLLDLFREQPICDQILPSELVVRSSTAPASEREAA
jgi:LacI family transcriptional regulator/LacI family repressor for deo operon, udp, cdd, tsx, nupC, and nupG